MDVTGWTGLGLGAHALNVLELLKDAGLHQVLVFGGKRQELDLVVGGVVGVYVRLGQHELRTGRVRRGLDALVDGDRLGDQELRPVVEARRAVPGPRRVRPGVWGPCSRWPWVATH